MSTTAAGEVADLQVRESVFRKLCMTSCTSLRASIMLTFYPIPKTWPSAYSNLEARGNARSAPGTPPSRSFGWDRLEYAEEKYSPTAIRDVKTSKVWQGRSATINDKEGLSSDI